MCISDIVCDRYNSKLIGTICSFSKTQEIFVIWNNGVGSWHLENDLVKLDNYDENTSGERTTPKKLF